MSELTDGYYPCFEDVQLITLSEVEGPPLNTPETYASMMEFLEKTAIHQALENGLAEWVTEPTDEDVCTSHLVLYAHVWAIITKESFK